MWLHRLIISRLADVKNKRKTRGWSREFWRNLLFRKASALEIVRETLLGNKKNFPRECALFAAARLSSFRLYLYFYVYFSTPSFAYPPEGCRCTYLDTAESRSDTSQRTSHCLGLNTLETLDENWQFKTRSWKFAVLKIFKERRSSNRCYFIPIFWIGIGKKNTPKARNWENWNFERK